MILVTYTEQINEQAPQTKQWITTTTDPKLLEQELVSRTQHQLNQQPIITIKIIATSPIENFSLNLPKQV